MPKRPDSLETLQLFHELLRRIHKGRRVIAPELCQQLADDGYELSDGVCSHIRLTPLITPAYLMSLLELIRQNHYFWGAVV